MNNKVEQLKNKQIIQYLKDLPSNYINTLREAINDVVKIEMNDNEFMTNESIIFSAKIKQIANFLQNDQYKQNLFNALENGNMNIIIDYIMQYDPEVFPKEWENENKRLTTSIIEECKPNSYIECEKCGKRTVFDKQRQVRSGDEGITTFHKCCSCGHIWTSE